MACDVYAPLGSWGSLIMTSLDRLSFCVLHRARQVNYTVRIAGEYEMAICFSAAVGGGVLPGSPYILTVHPAKASVRALHAPHGRCQCSSL